MERSPTEGRPLQPTSGKRPEKQCQVGVGSSRVGEKDQNTRWKKCCLIARAIPHLRPSTVIGSAADLRRFWSQLETSFKASMLHPDILAV